MSNKTAWTVYTHTSPSGKVYVGITKDLKDRWANKGAKYCTYESVFKHAIAKYGWDKLKHDIVLEGISKSEAIYTEKYLIRWYKIHDISYNITDGGEGAAGMKFSAERIQKAVNTRKTNSRYIYLIIGKDFSHSVFPTVEEAANFIGAQRANLSHVLRQPVGYTCKGYYVQKHEKELPIDMDLIKEQILLAREKRHQNVSNNTKARLPELIRASQAAMAKMTPEERKALHSTYGMQGKHHSAETKQKMSNRAKGRDMSKAIEASRKAPHDTVAKKAVIQLDLKNRIINEFSSITEAKEHLGKSSSAISNCLTGYAKTAFGYKWKYKTIGG